MQAASAFQLAVICGGPSRERGISLNSARSVMDHLKSPQLDILPLYVDHCKRFFRLSCAQLYSNTPADFDFKLHRTAVELDASALASFLQSVDLVFPVIHGAFGEDGELQALLEHYQVPFIGHASETCRWMFHKHQAAKTLKENGFATLPQVLLPLEQQEQRSVIEQFFKQHALQRAIVKPAIGGSSLGVASVTTPQEACVKAQELLSKNYCQQVLLESFCEGREFTIVVFENEEGEPVALVPTEIELSYEHNQIFDFRKKYLPTNQATYHTPPRFSEQAVEHIRKQAEHIFKLFGMRDFVRLDGWLMPDEKLYFTDINPISGLEQNSFLFRQASILGLTHREALKLIIKRACQRYGLQLPSEEQATQVASKQPVYVLFGSHNAERQVSLMSGTNVWLKLMQSPRYTPIPFLFDSQATIWKLPYAYALHHTVEEIYANCLAAQEKKENWQTLIETIRFKLGIQTQVEQQPQPMPLNHFLERTQTDKAFVFIAMHGGDGENGTLQRHLDAYHIPYNGSSAKTSALCMDKYLTGQAIQRLADPDILTTPKKNIELSHFASYREADFISFWQTCCQELESQRLIVKPRCDGCSAGIVLLQSAEDFARYCQLLLQKSAYIPPFSFANQTSPIEMPSSLTGEYLLEPYIETDEILLQDNQLHVIFKEGWIELTVGVLEQKGKYRALNPSITLAEGAVLSLEEKFQGGTGINLTPPPLEILSCHATQKIKHLIEKTAQALDIQNYARLDIFFNRLSEKMILIEANTLPALTPSTVIYHQGLAEEPALTPLDLLDHIISSKIS